MFNLKRNAVVEESFFDKSVSITEDRIKPKKKQDVHRIFFLLFILMLVIQILIVDYGYRMKMEYDDQISTLKNENNTYLNSLLRLEREIDELNIDSDNVQFHSNVDIETLASEVDILSYRTSRN